MISVCVLYRSFNFFVGEDDVYIDVAMILMALVEILRITLIIIEKCKRHSLMCISVFIVLL